MFGPQHCRHLLEVGGVAAFLGAGGEADRDDPLCDVDQVHLIALLHGLNHTLTPGKAETKESSLQTAFTFSAIIIFTAAVRTFLELSDFSRRLTTEFFTNIHLIKCKLPQLTLIFLGKEKIYNPSLLVDMTCADIM